jgi:hypothetical protein
MMLRMKNNLTIICVRTRPSEMVEELKSLLRDGAEARPDLSRRNFYELDGGVRVFYIYVSPATRKVTLLAVWDNTRRPVAPRVSRSELAACCGPAA